MEIKQNVVVSTKTLIDKETAKAKIKEICKAYSLAYGNEDVCNGVGKALAHAFDDIEEYKLVEKKKPTNNDIEVVKFVGDKKVFNVGGEYNGCYGCDDAPRTYSDYCAGQQGSCLICRNAYTEVARKCKLYNKEFEFK